MINVLIADDHAVVRAGVKLILEEAGDIVVAGEAPNGAVLMDMVRAADYDVVILDISMPGRSGAEVLLKLRSEKPQLPVLILSAYPEDQYAVRLIKGGAAGYLNKDSAPEQLVQAVHKVARGGRYISPTVAELLASQLASGADDGGHERLSTREYEVLRLLGSGKAVTEVAEMLSLSVKTVSTYRVRLMAKLGLHTNVELIRYAIEHDLTGGPRTF